MFCTKFFVIYAAGFKHDEIRRVLRDNTNIYSEFMCMISAVGSELMIRILKNAGHQTGLRKQNSPEISFQHFNRHQNKGIL